MFKKASKKSVYLKLAITGPTGSGKTFSALRLATGYGGKIAVIDTENGSASLYSDRFDFDVIDLSPPFTVSKYAEAIKAAEAGKYDFLVIDSLTHAWAGDGGLLAKKESMDARGGNSFTNWGAITKEHEDFKSWLLQSQINVIGTMRSKMEYAIESNDKGKQAPKKIGLAPIQRDGMEYEFTTVFDVAMNHEAHASKDRTSLFDGKYFQITEDTGKILKEWQGGEPIRVVGNPPAITSTGAPPATSTSQGDEYQPDTPITAGEWTITFGQKYKGQKLKEIPHDELRGYCNYIEDAAREKGHEIKGVAAEFLDKAALYLSGK